MRGTGKVGSRRLGRAPARANKNPNLVSAANCRPWSALPPGQRGKVPPRQRALWAHWNYNRPGRPSRGGVGRGRCSSMRKGCWCSLCANPLFALHKKLCGACGVSPEGLAPHERHREGWQQTIGKSPCPGKQKSQSCVCCQLPTLVGTSPRAERQSPASPKGVMGTLELQPSRQTLARGGWPGQV